jgi:hypothetical protein
MYIYETSGLEIYMLHAKKIGRKISPVPLILQNYSRLIFLGMNQNFPNNKWRQVDLVKAIDCTMANIK